jgi:hypothetical protein
MKYNRLLSDTDRERYKKLIDSMFLLCPEMMSRKIPLANVQQAFTLEAVGEFIKEGLGSSILCVGSFEDTAAECLTKNGIMLTKIDPLINMDLHTFIESDIRNNLLFGIIFSTSVIEHVEDDNQFLKDICSILEPNGVCILTCDFNNSYKPGDKLPYSDVRFYTKKDFTRMKKILKEYNCGLLDKPNWEGEPEFTHDGCTYSFGTFVFRKNP